MFSCIELTDGEPNNAMMPGQMLDEDSVIFRLLNTDAKSADTDLEQATTALTQVCKEEDLEGFRGESKILPSRLQAVKAVFAVYLNYHPDREQLMKEFIQRKRENAALKSLWARSVRIVNESKNMMRDEKLHSKASLLA